MCYFVFCSSGKTTLSASGILLQVPNGSADTGSGSDVKPPETVLVLTAASVIEPFVLQQYREKNTSKVGKLMSLCAQEIISCLL